MSFTELAILIRAIAASVVATHYWARHGAVQRVMVMAGMMQMKMLSEPEYYEELRAKYQRDMAAGVFGERT